MHKAVISLENKHLIRYARMMCDDFSFTARLHFLYLRIRAKKSCLTCNVTIFYLRKRIDLSTVQINLCISTRYWEPSRYADRHNIYADKNWYMWNHLFSFPLSITISVLTVSNRFAPPFAFVIPLSSYLPGASCPPLLPP